MKLEILNMGLFEVNNYLLFDEDSKDIVLIDAGGDFDLTKRTIENLGGNLKYLLNTHAHMDHIAGDYDIQKHYNVPIYIHKGDEEQIPYFKEYLRAVGMPDYEAPQNITFIDENETFKIGNKTIKTIHTPGHTQGGVAYIVDDMLFSGDSLFYESIGRTDLLGGNHNQLVNSVKTKLLTLPDDIKVYPGHGRQTTIGHEKVHNSFV
ncbi:MAG: MBL fold metallo-hydrolase [bacterium]|nr:MBL fold metallo-hydrolase [bacterium]